MGRVTISDLGLPESMLLLTRFARLHDAFVEAGTARRGFTSAEFRVLGLLEYRGADRPASPTLIASWIVQTSGGLTATLRRLADRGAIERLVDPHDGRGKLVAITPSGLAAYRSVRRELAEEFAELADSSALSDVIRGAIPMIEAYERAAGIPSISSFGWSAGPSPSTDLSTGGG